MKWDMTTRRAFLQTCAAGLGTVGFRPALFSQDISATARPILRIEPDPARGSISTLSWDTEGGDRFRTNLLRKESGIGLRVRIGDQWLAGTSLPAAAKSSGQNVRYSLQVKPQCTLAWEITPSRDSFTMTVSAEGSSLPPGSVEMVFPFDVRVTPTTVLPSHWRDDGRSEAPMVISAPDFGQLLLRTQPSADVTGRLEGDRKHHTADLVLEMPQLSADHQCILNFTPLYLPAPQGFHDESAWRRVRRSWFNAFQPSAQWGDQNRAFSSPAGILGNNVLSDPASLSLFFYADPVLWTPVAAEGISLAALVRRAIEFWLDQRTRTDGEVVGYWDYGNFLDSNAGPLTCAWDYVEATGDLSWLEKRIKRLEFVADFYARRDQDSDGLIEATQSGNANMLREPDRSCIWFDAVNHGHKDAYANALIYRALRCMADLEARLHREVQRSRYTLLADRLKVAYARTLYNPQTGWIADWRSADGKLHDYASPVANGMAIEYGLVEPSQARKIVNRLWTKMQEVGFKRCDLGLPPNLVPIHRSDYLQPDGYGCPKREDGTDTFQHYMNGGISAGQSKYFLVASYMAGEGAKADRVLEAMLARQQAGGFQNGVQNAADKGIDWTTWDGKPCGYEGYLADVYYFLQALLLREPALRARIHKPLSAA